MITTIALCICVRVLAQDALSLDEHRQYVFYRVVELSKVSSDSIYFRGLQFVKTAYPPVKLTSTTSNDRITGNGRFLVYGGISVIKHENGALSYTFHLECKEGRYRYWFTDFVYTPYTRDRYGNFVPVMGKEFPLEKGGDKLDKKEFASLLQEAGSFCALTGEKLKQKMQERPAKRNDVHTTKIITDKW